MTSFKMTSMLYHQIEKDGNKYLKDHILFSLTISAILFIIIFFFHDIRKLFRKLSL